jgi:hypothetical protein
MRLLLAFLITAAAFAQPPAPPAKPPEKAAPTPEAQAGAAATAPAKADDQAKPAEPAAAPAAAASPAPTPGEQWITGSVDFGYRWVSDVGGSLPTYRSIVNLGSGPKLTGLDFTITDPKHRLFDRLDARANAWGGDPYNTAHIDVSKRGLYELRGDYRNISYFNELPSFANPRAPLGFNEQAFDTHRRSGYIDLQLFPGKHFLPYLVYERNSGYGHGVETWVEDSNNEYAVPMLLRDSTNNYRGGFRLEYNRWHVTLEEGGTTYKDDDQASFNGVNYGDRTTSLLGTTLILNTLTQTYGTRGSSTYSKVLATASPFSWLDLNGQFLYSLPKTDARYFDSATGNFVLLSSLLLYSGQYDIGTAGASGKHVLGNAGAEIRPFKRLKIIESFSSNRYDETGIGALTEQILFTPGATYPALVSALSTPQVVTDNRQQVEAIVDVTRKLTLRAGYRYEWGDATVRAGVLSQTGPLAYGALKRSVGLAGATIRPWQKLSLNVDYEGALQGSLASQSYFRTSLYNDYKVRARAKYQVAASLWLQAVYNLLDNQDPTPGVQNDFRARDSSLALFWTPNGGKRVSVMAEYDRSTLRSSIDYLLLPFYVPSVSNYNENANTATTTIDLVLPAIGGIAPRISAGGSLFISSGSRATSYYQPLGRLSIPLQRHVQWNTEWRWYGFGETLYQYEGFRAHTLMTGLKLIK